MSDVLCVLQQPKWLLCYLRARPILTPTGLCLPQASSLDPNFLGTFYLQLNSIHSCESSQMYFVKNLNINVLNCCALGTQLLPNLFSKIVLCLNTANVKWPGTDSRSLSWSSTGYNRIQLSWVSFLPHPDGFWSPQTVMWKCTLKQTLSSPRCFWSCFSTATEALKPPPISLPLLQSSLRLLTSDTQDKTCLVKTLLCRSYFSSSNQNQWQFQIKGNTSMVSY